MQLAQFQEISCSRRMAERWRLAGTLVCLSGLLVLGNASVTFGKSPDGAASPAKSREQDAFPCDATLPEDSILLYARTLEGMTEDTDVTGVVLGFQLWVRNESCDAGGYSAVYRDEETLSCNYTQVPVQCDAEFANLTRHDANRRIESNVTMATRYFHPLQQIWSRRSDPTPILHLPPEREALSMGLLSDHHLRVRHIAIKMLISSEECWRGLSQAVQSSVTLSLSQSSAPLGLAAPGIFNGTGQLCQLRYASKTDYALLAASTASDNEEFAYFCCSADSQYNVLACRKVTSFSRWYDGNTWVIFVGILMALLLCPLPCMTALTPPTPTGHSGGYQALPNAAGQEAAYSIQMDDTGQSSVHTALHRSSGVPSMSMAVTAGEAGAHRLAMTTLVHASRIRQVSSADILSTIWYGQPHRFFVANTGAKSHIPVDPILVVPEWVHNYHIGYYLAWITLLLAPLVLLALRAIAFRVSNFSTSLECMLRLDMASPWLLFNTAVDYAILAPYCIIGSVCMLANLSDMQTHLQHPIDSGCALFPSSPAVFSPPSSGGAHSGLMRHILAVYKQYSLVRLIYSTKIRGASREVQSLWMPLCILAVVPDLPLLALVAGVSFLYSTPTGFALVRLSQAAGSSVTILAQHTCLHASLGVLVSVAWFITLLCILLLVLLLTVWIILTVQFTIVGLVYNLEKYIDAVIQIATFVLYLRHYWQKIETKYNHIQTSVIANYHKVQGEEDLVQRIAKAVRGKMRPDQPASSASAGHHQTDGTLFEARDDRDESTLHVPTVAFHNMVTQVYPVRYIALKTLFSFLGVCVYLATLNATLLMTGSLQQKYSTFGKSIVLVLGSALPKFIEFLTNDSADEARKLETHAEQSVRQVVTAVRLAAESS